METCAQESNLFFKILPSAIKQIMNFTESIRWPKRVALNKELACLYLLFRKGSKGKQMKKAGTNNPLFLLGDSLLIK